MMRVMNLDEKPDLIVTLFPRVNPTEVALDYYVSFWAKRSSYVPIDAHL